MEDILAKLVAFRSVSSDIAANDAALDFIAQHLTRHGMHVKRFRFDGNGALVATTRSHRKDPRILLYAHTDVVVGSDDVFKLRKESDILIGRGTYDMKFAIAGYMQLVEDLGSTLDEYDFGIVLISDEELMGQGGVNGLPHILRDGYRAEVVIMPDGGSDWKVERVAKGGWRFNLISEGRAAHSSRPWEGESASFKLLQALHDLHDHFKNHGPETDTLNIGMLKGGETYNQIPSLMTAGVEIRLTRKDSYMRNKKFIEALCQKHNITFQDIVCLPPVTTDTTKPLIRTFINCITAVLGEERGTCISYGGSDAVFFEEYGIPCILTRPAGGGHHGEHEWVNRSSLAKMPVILKKYLDAVAHDPTPVDKPAAPQVK